MMSLQLYETFYGFKIQRPVQCVLRIQGPPAFQINTMSYLNLCAYLVSKGFLQPWPQLLIKKVDSAFRYPVDNEIGFPYQLDSDLSGG